MDKRLLLLFAVIVYVICAVVFIYVCLRTDDTEVITMAGYVVSSSITVATLVVAVLLLKSAPSEEYRERFMKDEEEGKE